MSKGNLFSQLVPLRRFALCIVIVTAFHLSTSFRLTAAVLTWTNTAGGNWNNAANWSPNQVPGPTDNATLSLSVNVTNNALSSVSNLVFSPSTFYGNVPVTVFGTMNWVGGDMCGAITIAVGGRLTMSNSPSFGRNGGFNNGGGVLTNLGTAIWAGGSISGFGNAVIQNSGLWEIVANNNLSSSSGTNLFINSGDLEEIVSGAATLGWTFNCTGTVNTPNGSLTMGNWFGASTVNGNVIFSIGAMNGSLAVASNSVIAWTAGTVNGAISVSPGGVLNWSGGDLDGSLTISPGATLSFSNNVTFGRNGGFNNGGGALTNFGTVVLAGSTHTGYGNAVINNSGLWQIVANNNLSVGTGTNIFINNGDIEELVSGVATISWTFNCNGTINTPTGSLTMGPWFGASTLSGNATFSIGLMNGSLAVAPNAVIGWTAGTVNGATSVSPGGVLNWSGGDLDGSLTISPGGTLSFSNNVTFGRNGGFNNGGGALTNFGTVVYAGANHTGFGNAVIYNSGLWEVAANNNLSVGTGTNVFINAGTIEKTNSGTASLQWPFTSTGTFNTTIGTLTLQTWVGTNVLHGTASLGISETVGSVTIASGGFFNWLSGDLLGALIVSPGATLAVSNSISFGRNGGFNNGGGALTNFGTVLWAGNVNQNGYGGAVIYNAGLWQFFDANNLSVGTGTNTFINTGTLTKFGASATSLSWFFNTTGLITNTPSSQLVLSSWTGNSIVQGNANLSLGTMNTSLTVASGALLNWTGGDIIGTFIVAPGGTLAVSNSITFGRNGGFNNGGGALTNFGTVIWAGNVNQNGYGGAVIDNAGLWQFFDANNLLVGTGTNTFINTGTLTKFGVSSSTLSWFFNTSGFITNTPSSQFTLSSWTGNSVVQGTANLSLGTMNTSLTVASNSFLNWTGGDIIGTLLVAPGGLLAVSNGITFGNNNGTHTGGGALTNSGTVIWAGNVNQNGYGGAVIDNTGLWEFFDSNNLLTGTGTNTFINSGTLEKIANTSTTINWNFSNAGTVDSGAGALSMQNGFHQTDGQTLLLGGNLSVSPSLQLDGGVLAGSNTITGPVTNNSIVKPGGDAPGQLTISGSYFQTTNGELDIQIGGTNVATDYDQLAVSGAINLSGTLNVTLIDPFVPAVSNSFRIVTFASRTGDFSSVNGLVLTTNLALQATYSGSALDLVAASTNSPGAPPTIVAQPQSQNIINGETANFAVTATGTRPLFYQWELNGIAISNQNSPTLTLVNAQTNAAGSYQVIVTNNAGSVTSSVATLTVQPVADLVITQPTNPTNAFATQPVTFTWRSLNQGVQTAVAPWIETIGLSTNITGIPATLISSITVTSSLVSGQSIVRTQSVILPGGLDGTYYVVFTTDAGNQVVELDYETNNVTVSPVPITIHSPDLQPIAIGAPASAQLGQGISVSWVDTNSGASPVFSPWIDQVYLGPVSNSLSGSSFLTSFGVTNVPFASFTNITNNAGVTLPSAATLSPGNYFLVVDVDAGNAIAETNENNNLLSVPISLTLPPLPDLAPLNVLAPTNAVPGATVPISWIVTNQGSLAITDSWSETVFLATNSAGAGATEVATFTFTNSLPVGGSVARLQMVPVPINSSFGSNWFTVQVDSLNDIVEANESNNLAIATNATLIPAQLTLEFSVDQAVEGSASFTGIVTRNGNQASALTVTLTNNNTSELSVPAQVVIPAGQASQAFIATPLDDGIVDGSQLVTVTAGAAGFNPGSAQVTVLNVDRANLGLTFQTNSVLEGQTVAATISRSGGTNSALSVNFNNSNPGRLVTPAQVTIPEGAFSNVFVMMAPDDLIVEPPTSISVTAFATNCNSASASVTVLDADLPQLTLTFASTNINETGGPQATTATLTRSPINNAPLFVEMVSSDPNSLVVPSLITIPASAGSISFPIGSINNHLVTGSKTIEVDQWVKTSPGGARVAEATPVFVTVIDNDSPALQLTLASSLLGKGNNPATTGTVSRNGSTNASLLVNLVSSDTTQATVPVSVSIPAGASSATFNVATLNDGVAGGSKSLTINASATGFASATAPLTVSDSSLPDLIVQSVTAPTNGDTQTFVNLGYTIRNQGLAAMPSNSVIQSIYLSTDTVPGDGILEGKFAFNGGLPAGTQFGQSFSVQLPQTAGDYWVIVQTDVSNAVAEVLEDNNTGISAVPIHVTAAYDAIVSTTLVTAPANTPVPLTGHAFKPGNIPAPFVLVNIHIYVQGTHRIISAITDAGGNFSATWQPLPGEAGFYQIGAAHPGFADAPTQATFTLYGMKAVPALPSVTLLGENVSTGAVQIVNAGDVPLSSVTATVVNPPSDLNFTLNLATNSIGSLGSNTLSYTLNSTDGQAESGTVVVHLTSAEGAVLDLPFSISVMSLNPQLVATPSPLVRGIKPGEQSFVSFVVTNIGGATSGPVTVSLPNLPWMSLTSTNPLPSLAPGDGVTVSLQLMPDPSMPLGEVTGNILLSAAGTVASVPFDFRVLSDATGSLLVNSQDEFTYYAVGSPPLTNATATLLDPTTGNVVTNGVTDAAGRWFVPALPEGYYTLQLSASNHSDYQAPLFLSAGLTNTVNTFLQLKTVTYTWTVVPTEIQDHYTIAVKTEFEANVPAPVVTIDPSVIDLSAVTTSTQVNLTIANHGLIAAQNFELQFDPYPNLSFQPLVSSLGTLPPQSTFTIPLVITRTNTESKGVQPKDLSDIAECFATARGMDEYVCGPNLNFQVSTISFPNAGACLAKLIPGFSWLPGGGGGGNFYCLDCGRPPPPPRPPGTWPNFGGNTNGNPILEFLAAVAEKACPALVIPNACDPECTPKLALALFQCSMPPSKGPPPCLKDVAAGCGPAAFRNKTYNDAVDCTAGIAKCWVDAAKEVTHTECLFAILEACAPPEERPILRPNGFLQRNDLTFSGPYADLLATLQTRVDRIAAVNNYSYYLWGDPAWGNTSDQSNAAVILNLFVADRDTNSDAGVFISPAELSGMLSLPLPAGITSSNVTHLATWWNHTITNWQAGIFYLTDATNGQSTDFFALDQFNSIIQNATNALAASEADGFSSLEDGIQDAVGEIVQKLSIPAGGTCAKVQLQLNQQAVLSRDAFKATLSINNTEGEPLQNLNVTIGVFDTNGNDASSLFGIQPAVLGGITGTNGDGSVPTGGTGTLTWTLVPVSDAAPSNVTSYFVSGGLNYTVSDNSVSIPLAPTPISVYPSPRLSVKYFHQRDVFADDPNTPIVEPSVPFSLGVMVQNTGKGTARNFTITSAQPQIVDNEKGLLINFQIIATQVAGQNLQPTLTANMGDIAPGTNAIAQWLMTSTLQGLFISYSASFQHVDDLGSPRLSLIDDISIHEMTHVVDAGGPFEDGRPDFLVNDIPDVNSFPDRLYLSDGSTNNVQAVTNDAVFGTLSPANLQVQITAPMPGGWAYLNVPDPGNGSYRLVSIVRSDSVNIPVNINAWVTDRTFIGLGKRPILQNILHLLDYNSTGSYTLTYVPNPGADTTPPTSAVAPLPAQSSIGIPLRWSGQDDLSGIASFDIYTSVNGGAFQPWLTGVTGSSAIYQGVLSNTYAFYSLAVDHAGNRQAPPSTPDAVTTVTMTNHPPQIAAISNQTVLAGNTLSLTIPASDPDSNTLTFTLGAGAPPGVALNSQNGFLTWTTGRSAGSSTNTISVIATDSGIPSLSATQSFQVFVISTNTPPMLSPIANQIISAGQLLAITNTASDADLPPQQLTFSLGPGAPTGMLLNSSSGVLTWTPANFQGGTTNPIQVIVTDNGTPPLSATNQFSVTVVANGPGMVFSIGTTDLLVGATSSVPLSLITDADLTNLTVLLNLNSVQLTNLTLSGFASQVASAQIQPVANDQYQLQFQSQANTRLQGNFNMAALGFGTTPSSNSAIVALTGQSLSGLRGTSTNPVTGVVNGGRVFVIGNQPLLDAGEDTNQQLALTIYGLPGKRYSLEALPGISGTNGHTVVSTFKVRALKTGLPSLPMQQPIQFFRARLLPDSDLTVNLQSNQITIDWPLECTNCLLQQSSQLGTGASWSPVGATQAIVNTNWQVTIPAPPGTEYYRLLLPP